MPTLEEYIKKRKREEGIDEFNVDERVANMGRCINFVVEFFDTYVDPNKKNMEYEKRKAKCKKYRKRIRNYPQDLVEWLVSIYMKYEARFDQRAKYIIRQDPIYLLSYNEDNFLKLADIFLSKYVSEIPIIKGKEVMIAKLFKAEIGLRHNKNSYSLQKYHQLGNKINKWLKETYKTYGINISVFASKYIFDFYDKTHEYEYDKEKGKVYLVKAYDYKNSDNLFAIDEVYKKNKKKPFIENRKLELEILFMHFWLSEIFGEEGFWEVYLSKYPEKEEIVKR
mgnify:CR=1 FL=1